MSGIMGKMFLKLDEGKIREKSQPSNPLPAMSWRPHGQHLRISQISRKANDNGRGVCLGAFTAPSHPLSDVVNQKSDRVTQLSGLTAKLDDPVKILSDKYQNGDN